ncbi:MAG: glycosyltransferase [Candidatus Kapaibacterium sp.]
MRESDAADTGTVSMKSAATASPRGPGRTIVDVNPIISIVIPALNEEKLIEQTLRVFSPELRARHGVELIVSDGGSRDRTVEIAREHADIVVEHREERRQTISEGRNRGAEMATGTLLVFICADTIPRDPEKFMRGLTQFARSAPDGRRIAAIACPVEIAPEERRTSDLLFHAFFNNYVRLLNLVGIGMGRGECQVIRRDSFLAVGGYDSAMVAGEDFDLYSRLARIGRIGHSNDLRVYESPRRFRRYGYLRVLASWTTNGLAVMLLHRSVSKEWEEIR